jgi:hypothetical protein
MGYKRIVENPKFIANFDCVYESSLVEYRVAETDTITSDKLYFIFKSYLSRIDRYPELI